MLAPASRFLARVSCTALLCLPLAPAFAFGPQTHAWLALRAQQDISRDCRLEIAGRRYAVSDESCRAIRDYPAYFMTGATGTGQYPDPVTARLTLRQGVPGGWQSGEWLQQLVQKADTPQALAYALGNVFQAGQEVFANSYVNAFAGAPFSLQADDAVLARHIAIERYLDAHLPESAAQAMPQQLPLSYLRAVLMSDAQSLAQYRRLPDAAHLVAMSEVGPALEKTLRGLASVQRMTADMLDYYSSLPQTREALQQEFGTPRVMQEQAARQAATNEARWLNAKAMLARQTEETARAGIELQQLQARRSALAAQLQQQEKRLASLPSRRSKESCRNVRKWINAREWTSNRVCHASSEPNPAHGKARGLRDALRKDMAEMEAREKSLALRKGMADAELRTAQQALQQADEERQQRVLDSAAPEFSVLAARRDEAILALQAALAALDELALLGRQWQDDIVQADNDYLRLALPERQSAATAGRVEDYRQWLSCSGRVFLEHTVASATDCRDELPEVQLQAVLEKLERVLKQPALLPLNEVYQGVRLDDIAALQRHVQGASQALAQFMAPASALDRLSRLAADSAGMPRDRLQLLLAEPGTAPLLTVRNGADLIDADAGIEEGQALDADAFNALQYADRFARMALLPGRELNRLAGRAAGMRFTRWKLHPEDSPRYSLLYQSLRSMEGNQQWQPYGLPYARLSGAPQPENAEQRHYGYGPADGDGAGLAIFIDAKARRQVFRQLFPQPLSLLETHPRLQAPNYPFPSCAENPFPVTFTRAGKAALADNSCSPRELVQH